MGEHNKIIVGVIGSGGFIGSHLVPVLSANANLDVRLLQHKRTLNYPGCKIYSGGVEGGGELSNFLAGCKLLINLSHPSVQADDGLYERAIVSFSRAVRDAGVGRLVHLSTAMVSGSPRQLQVSEDVVGPVSSSYERNKRVAEEILFSELQGVTDLGILRPTAVFGSGGLNLLKLIRVVYSSPALKRHFLRFFNGNRRLHLVSVKDVVSALIFLLFSGRELSGNSFIVGCDEDRLNNYQTVDNMLGVALGKSNLKDSPRLPSSLLHFLLLVLGRSQPNPNMVFSSRKLVEWGWRSEVDFSEEIKSFAEAWYEEVVRK